MSAALMGSLASAATAQDTVAASPQLPSRPADPPPLSAPPSGVMDRMTFAVLADFYATANSNHPGDQVNAYRNFDLHSGTPRLSYVELAAESKPSPSQRLGFRLDLGAGPLAEFIAATDPGPAVFEYVQQAYVSVLTPVGSGLTVDVGKFVTPAGAEVIETVDNWNYSRSLLFSWAAPYYHAGIRASYALPRGVTATAFLVNGWNNVRDNNGGKSVAGQLIVAPTSRLTVAATWMGGPELRDDDGWRHLIDASATARLSDRVQAQVNIDVARDRGLGPNVGWHGVAAAVRTDLRPGWSLTPRVEWFADPQGASTGTAQELVEATITLQRVVGSGWVMRGEYRVDRSNVEAFSSGTTARRAQHTLGLGAVYAWRRP